MDDMVDAINNAYQELVDAVATTLESKDQETSSSSPSSSCSTLTDDEDNTTALENLEHKLELFRHACDVADEFVESAKLRFGLSEELFVVDDEEPVGSVVGVGIPPISAVSLEPMCLRPWELPMLLLSPNEE